MNLKDKLTPENKFIAKYFSLAFFEGLNFLAPYLAIMFNDYGLNAKQITFIFVIIQFSQLIFEIPTGALADRFGRKNVLLISNLLNILSLAILLLGKNFGLLLIFSWLSGLSLSLISGTDMALIYDNMKNLGIAGQFSKLRGRSRSINLGAQSLSALGASYLIRFGYNRLIVISIFFSLCYFFNITLFEDSFGTNTENIKKLNKNYWRILFRGIKYLFKHTTILKFTLSFVMIGAILKTIVLQFKELFLLEITLKKELVGILISIEIIIEAFSKWFLIEPLSKRKILKTMFVIVLATVFMFVGFIYYLFPISYILLILYLSLCGVGMTAVWGKYQELLPSRWRSTIVSMNNFLRNISCIFYLFIFGIVADLFSYKNGFRILIGFQLFLVILFVFVLGFDKHLRKKERGLR